MNSLWRLRGLALALCLAIACPAIADEVDAFDSDDAFAESKDDKKDDKKEEKKKNGKNDPKAAAAPAEKPGDDKPFDTVIKDMEESKGLFTVYRKADENKTLIEIQPSQLDKLYLFSISVDQAVGERGFYAAQMGGDFPFYFRKVGKTIQWVQKNTSFTAEPNTPAARATARSFPNAILAAAKIQSKPHGERKSYLIDATELFAGKDIAGIAVGLSQAYQPTNFTYDKEKSSVSAAKAFPENMLFDLSLHYQTENARTPSITLADARSVPVLLKYGISQLQDVAAFKPRPADDRIGHFHTVQQDFTSDKPYTPYTRYINRWHIEKTDPAAALSPAKEPIVFWLENTIPLEYRKYFEEGVLMWNQAFEKIGIQNALVVKQQPDSADWDPADVRYNTIRWFAGVDAAFAIGPSRANPFTGQIYDADIGFSEGIIRNARRLGEEYVSPVSMESEQQPLMWAFGRSARHQCTYATGLSEQAALANTMLDVRGNYTPEMQEKLMKEYIVEVTAHEVGHTLGFRHNFRASSVLSLNDLHDAAKTSTVGQSSSVMDYNPVMVAPDGKPQGEFCPTTLGPYDYWAVEYAYANVGNEALGAIAARAASDPNLPYSTDEDALGTYSAMSIDPFANQYDQSTDPLAYFRERVGLVKELWAGMEGSLARPGEGYQVMRRALSRSMSEMNRSLLTSSKFIGGIYHVRDHVGDPGARSPYTPVPAAKQREALEFLAENAFGAKAFVLAPSLHNKLAVERLPALDWTSYYGIQRLDYPWHDAVLNLQRGVLARLHHPVTLGRIQDNELRFAAGERPFRMNDMFTSLSNTIWSELDGGDAEITSLRRNLQREHLRQLTRLALREVPPTQGPFGQAAAAQPPLPEDATTLARATLSRIQTKITTKLGGKAALDATTRAHLVETRARIEKVLDAQMQASVN